jgi:phosphoribosylanthranilate isomerase
MPVEVKICGLSTLATVDAALDAGADLIGLVFYPKSPRYVTLEAAAELAKRARGRAKVVALIVDAPDPLIVEIAARVHPDLYQAHGSESPARIEAIAHLTGKPVIKAIKVKEPSDLSAARAYDGKAAIILYDAKAPETLRGALPGGNGLSFDWSLLEGGASADQFILLGGLTPDNVGAAIKMTGAAIVDVSSGVERAPGVKDPALIRNFIEAAKSAR